MTTIARVITLASVSILLAACSKEPAAPASGGSAENPPPTKTGPVEQVADAAVRAANGAKGYAHSADEKLAKLRGDAQEFIDKHKGEASDDSSQAVKDLKAAMDDAGRSLGHLKDAGQSTWQENKPKVDSALQTLEAKLQDAKARIERALPAPTTQPAPDP